MCDMLNKFQRLRTKKNYQYYQRNLQSQGLERCSGGWGVPANCSIHGQWDFFRSPGIVPGQPWSREALGFVNCAINCISFAQETKTTSMKFVTILCLLIGYTAGNTFSESNYCFPFNLVFHDKYFCQIWQRQKCDYSLKNVFKVLLSNVHFPNVLAVVWRT